MIVSAQLKGGKNEHAQGLDNRSPLVIAAGLWYLFRPELLFIKTTVNEELPPAQSEEADSEPVALLTGQFHGVAHETEGTATVYRLSDGSHLLRLTDFRTSNGPDVQVYLVKASDADDADTVTQAGFLPLGKLKGTEGDQNYEIPADIDLGTYRSVTIWCARFSVNFGTAPLAETRTTGIGAATPSL